MLNCTPLHYSFHKLSFGLQIAEECLVRSFQTTLRWQASQCPYTLDSVWENSCAFRKEFAQPSNLLALGIWSCPINNDCVFSLMALSASRINQGLCLYTKRKTYILNLDKLFLSKERKSGLSKKKQNTTPLSITQIPSVSSEWFAF